VEHYKRILSFVRRKGKRKLSTNKQSLMSEILPKVEIINFDKDQNFERLLKTKNKKINLEIGYGNGEHFLMQAQKYTEEIFIGCEPFVNGTAQLISKLADKNLENIFIYQGDAMDFLEKLPSNFLDKIFLLFPDPWPKKKHLKRRIIKDENISIFEKKLKTNGLFRFSSDHGDYASWGLAKFTNNKNWNWNCENIKDWLKEPKDWTQTKYQKKSLAGTTYYFFDFIKKN
jgi:tRNA (guanine-N7-)-methyltransferase